MSFNGASYGAAKKLVQGLASGFDHTEKTGDNSFKIFFKNGTSIDLTIPQPEIDYDKLEEDMDKYILDWLEEHKDEIKGKDGKTVQILSADETEADIEEEAVLIFQENEFNEMETYNKAQSDARFAKSVNVGDVSKLAVSTWKDLTTALNDVFGRGMGSYKFEVDENKKQLTIVCRNGAEVPIDISQIILNTNITEFKDMLVTSILDGQSLVWNASKKKWVNKSIDSSGVLVEAKQYTDDEIKKFNNKGSLAVDEKPTYYGGIITYKQGGETKTTDNAGTWFYYFDDNDKAVQTIFIEGTEFTIAMAGDINLDDYVAKTEKTDTYDENFTDKTKVPTTRYVEEFKEVLDEEIGAKVNTADIVDDLSSDAVDKPLSAKQGKELNSTKLNKTTDVENSGKALVVDGSGNIVFGDAGVKVSSEEGNKITEKDDGIFVASEIDDENTSEDGTWSSKKINVNLGELEENYGKKEITDCDTVKETVSYIAPSTLHSPRAEGVTQNARGILISAIREAPDDYCVQTAIMNGSGQHFTRYKNAGNPWGAWQELATMDSIKNSAVETTGLKIVNTNGIFQIINWSDGLHLRLFHGNPSSQTYTDLTIGDNTLKLSKVVNGVITSDRAL